ncbi:HepT-like ribonuclease domain-containing protein [Dyadobacter psychrophilus]|uniref:Uncharacterized conserved protein, contains HEPN domain n=1 Tax=Dyadobacter psychrophilus TaxID=651661 RepID=A0A1T5GRS8_9BACT|nr:HepT-like ribonuclease domain-containing protein [Dyadobacter psychrophilus]SKC11040.1 Uncharacterized conserved protein, contains HEPN domain [Dyadobacter psychrophilus]
MIRDDRVYIRDIIESIEIINDYVTGKSERDFEESNLLQDAVYRRFEIIGEAAAKVSEACKDAPPEIEWRLMKLMRNKLIHEYFGISATAVFATIIEDLPPLLAKIKMI